MHIQAVVITIYTNGCLDYESAVLGDHARAGATSSPWPTEMDFPVTVVVGHHTSVVQAFDLEQRHQANDSCTNRIYLIT